MLQNRQALCEETLNLVLVGVSCRNYAQAVEAEKRMRKVRGWRGLGELKERLRREVASPSIFNYT